MRILIYVTHLLGTGHLSRALTLARAFAAKGHAAHVVSGGCPVANLSAENVTLHQLPPVKSDGVNFTRLLQENGALADEIYLADRKSQMVNYLHQLAPDVIITELYPFGRRILKGEFLAMLNATRDLPVKPVIYASVRDILAPPSKPQKTLETEAVIAAYYDGVLVHSVPETTPLEASWPVSPTLAPKLIYTGYVAPPPAGPHPECVGTDAVLVTAGGGDVGMPLFQAALAAAEQTPELSWHLLIGGSDKERNISMLKSEMKSENVLIEATRPDFRQMITHAKATVCMCGYNTAMDVLQTPIPAVFVPFDVGGETEQPLRAESLAKLDGYSVIPAAQASGERLAEAVKQVCETPPKANDPSQFKGAEATVSIVENAMKDRSNG